MTNNKTNPINLEKYLGQSVKIFLTNGVKITGTVKVVYSDGVLLSSAQYPDQEIFRHALATISEQQSD